MTKRNNNDGSIFLDTVRKGYRVMITPPHGKRITKRFPGITEESHAKAIDWRNEQLLKLGRGQLVEPTMITLGEWLLEWVQVYKKPPKIRQRSYDRQLSLIKHCASIADLKIQAITPLTINKLYKDLSDFSGETRKKVHNLLNDAFREAIRNKLVYSNPLEGLKAPKVVTEEVVIFSLEELQNILTAAADHPYYYLVYLASKTGMRLSEVLGLRWQDVDFSESCIYIRQTLQRSRIGIIFEEPKSKNSKRKITLTPKTMEKMKKLHKQTLEDRLKTGTINELCFLSSTGTPIDPSNFEHWWIRLQRQISPEYQKLEIERKILVKEKKKDTDEYRVLIRTQRGLHKKFHALRHTHATMLLAKGVPIIDVSRRLGHAKPSITMDLYGHTMPGQDKKLAKQIDKIYDL